MKDKEIEMDKITKKDITIIENVLTEGFLFADKMAFWPEEFEAIIKMYFSMEDAKKKYLSAAKKLGKEELDYVSLEYSIIISSTVSRIFSKKTRGTSKLILALRDGNGIAPRNLKVGTYDKKEKIGAHTVIEKTVVVKVN